MRDLHGLSELFGIFNATIMVNDTDDGIFDFAEDLLKNELQEYFAKIEPSLKLNSGEATHDFPLSYRIVATLIHSIIFVVGVVGNIILIVAAKKSRSLRTPTYTYLVSLSFADLLVLCTAVPEAIVSHHAGKRWLFGPVGCAIFVFLNFLGINMGSLSIMTFTFERYIAVCRPLLAYRLCTIERTKKIIAFGWILVIIYCCPWFVLTEVVVEPNFPDRQQCKFRMSPKQYSAFFITDLAIFYVVPLLIALVSYVKIITTVKKRTNVSANGSVRRLNTADCETMKTSRKRQRSSISHGAAASISHHRPNNSINRMLVMVVVFFAICWFPYRFLLIYNSFVTKPWLKIWFLLFAKSLIYMNCAINPILYNIMSQRFRMAVKRTVCTCLSKPSNHSNTSPRGYGSTASVVYQERNGIKVDLKANYRHSTCEMRLL